MHFDYQMALGSFLVAIVVGLTGMGGGALMTPMLTVFFGVPPLTAVSSDLVAAAVMKPVGSHVHENEVARGVHHAAHLRPGRGVRGDRRADRDPAVPGDLGGDI